METRIINKQTTKQTQKNIYKKWPFAVCCLSRLQQIQQQQQQQKTFDFILKYIYIYKYYSRAEIYKSFNPIIFNRKLQKYTNNIICSIISAQQP